MGRSVPHSPTLYFSLPEELDVSVPRSPCHDWSVPLLPLSSPYMKSLKLDDQFFIKIYIFVQKRHTYVIMAKSEVTGCVCFCQGASSAANYHLRFPGIEPPPQLAVAAGPPLSPSYPVQSSDAASGPLCALPGGGGDSPAVCGGCSRPFAATDAAKLLPVGSL